MLSCQNCTISYNELKKSAQVTWECGQKKTLRDVNCKSLIIPAKDSGFYLLCEKGVLHYVDKNTVKTVIDDNDAWFDKCDENQVIYFSATNVLLIAFLEGDHDYVWWWKLDTHNQKANLESPLYYNGTWNNELNVYKLDDRFAVCEEYIHEFFTDRMEEEGIKDLDDYEDDSEEKRQDSDFSTTILDTLTLKTFEFKERQSKQRLEELIEDIKRNH